MHRINNSMMPIHTPVIHLPIISCWFFHSKATYGNSIHLISVDLCVWDSKARTGLRLHRKDWKCGLLLPSTPKSTTISMQLFMTSAISPTRAEDHRIECPGVHQDGVFWKYEPFEYRKRVRQMCFDDKACLRRTNKKYQCWWWGCDPGP